MSAICLLIKLSSTLALCQKIGLSMLAYKGKKFLLDPEINLSSFESNLRSLVALITLQCFGFFRSPAAKGCCIQTEVTFKS